MVLWRKTRQSDHRPVRFGATQAGNPAWRLRRRQFGSRAAGDGSPEPVPAAKADTSIQAHSHIFPKLYCTQPQNQKTAEMFQKALGVLKIRMICECSCSAARNTSLGKA